MTPPTQPPLLAIALAALAVGGLAGAGTVPGSEEEPEIRPGSEIVEPGPCTLNWVFDDEAGNVYVGTADHCVGEVGQPVRTAGFDAAIGTVAYLGGGFGGADDFALVEIHDAYEDQIDPATRGIGGPTGLYRPAPVDLQETTTTPGASDERLHPLPVLFHGHGTGWGDDEETRTRGGTVTEVGEDAFTFVGPVTGGDSGAPVQSTAGQAVGVVAGNAGTVVGIEPGTPGPVDQKVSGPLLVDSLRAAEDALATELSLRTAPPIAADPVPDEPSR